MNVSAHLKCDVWVETAHWPCTDIALDVLLLLTDFLEEYKINLMVIWDLGKEMAC